MSERKYGINQTIEIINLERFTKSYENFLNGKSHFAELNSKDVLFRAFDTLPLDGFEVPEKFPYCCKWHTDIYEKAKDKLNKFPGCCEGHKKLIGQDWFDKLDYAYLPEKVVNTIAYTLHCIDESASEDNWYKKITDYIDYTAQSYGQFPSGHGGPLGLTHYLSCIEVNISERQSLNERQKAEIISYLENKISPNRAVRTPDLNQLMDTYKQWLRVFPFNISYLSHLKPHYDKLLPIFCGPFDINSFTGLTSAKLISKKQLLSFLTDSTRDIIKKLNALEAFKVGELSDRENTKIEIANARHQLNLETLSVSDKDNDKMYFKLLKKWLKNEKEYISELTVILANDYSKETFALNIIDGMQQLQSGDTNEHCLMEVRSKGKERESQIRYWFRTFLKARYKGSDVTAEEQNGPGYMDLKVFHPNMGLKIIEFKGWWNYEKKGIVKQITNYLTDAQDDGYIFMINHLENKDITSDYKKIIENKEHGYLDGTWVVHEVPNTSMIYYETKHKLAIKVKTIFQFILNVYF